MKKALKSIPGMLSGVMAYRLGLQPLAQFYQINYCRLVDAYSWANLRVHGKKPKPVRFSDVLVVAATTFCNAQCNFCIYRKLKKEPHMHMPLPLFKRIVGEFREMGGKEIILTSPQGEALLDPTVFDKIRYCKSKGIMTRLNTNGLLLGVNSNFIKLLDAGITSLTISIGDIVPKHEAEIFGVSEQAAARKMDGILSLLNEVEKRKTGFRVLLHFRPKRDVSDILKDFDKSKFKEYYDKHLLDIGFLLAYGNWSGNLEQKDLLGMQRLKYSPKIREYPCSSLYLLSIMPNGDMRACGCSVKDTLEDDLVIGNANSMGLKEAFKSEKWNKIIREFGSRKPKACAECNLYFPKA